MDNINRQINQQSMINLTHNNQQNRANTNNQNRQNSLFQQQNTADTIHSMQKNTTNRRYSESRSTATNFKRVFEMIDVLTKKIDVRFQIMQKKNARRFQNIEKKITKFQLRLVKLEQQSQKKSLPYKAHNTKNRISAAKKRSFTKKAQRSKSQSKKPESIQIIQIPSSLMITSRRVQEGINQNLVPQQQIRVPVETRIKRRPGKRDLRLWL